MRLQIKMTSCILAIVIVMLSFSTASVSVVGEDALSLIAEDLSTQNVEISTKEENENEIDYSGRDDLPYESDVLDAYERVCVYLYESKADFDISIEDFNKMYQTIANGCYSMDELLDECIKQLSYKKADDVALLYSSSNISNENVDESIDESIEIEENLLEAYNSLINYIESNNISFSVSYDEFYASYYSNISYFESVEDYMTLCLENLSQLRNTETSGIAPASTSSSDDTWYYNTGTTLYVKPSYSKYNLLGIVQAGDIIYEAKGGFYITGHCAIVEGIFYNSKYNQYYIRIIESIAYVSGSGSGDGVCRGVFDDTRYDNRDAYILHPFPATSSMRSEAIKFCVNQIGKDYLIDLTINEMSAASSTNNNWYCSELVWAAYYNQGLNLLPVVVLAITPKSIYESSNVAHTIISSVSTPYPTITVINSTSIKISWTSVSDNASYQVYRSSTSANGTYTLLTTTSNTSYTDTTCTSGNHYFYRVKAGQTGNLSQPKGVWLAFYGPNIVSYYSPTNTTAYLEWSKVYGATSYYIYRSTDGSTFTKVSTTSATSKTLAGLTANTTYYFKICAYSSSSSSLSSDSITVTIRTATVEMPVIYYARSDSSDTVTIKWSNVPDATSYYIYRATSANGSYSRVGISTECSFSNEGLQSSTTYYYKVCALIGGTCSVLSSYKHIKTSS